MELIRASVRETVSVLSFHYYFIKKVVTVVNSLYFSG